MTDVEIYIEDQLIDISDEEDIVQSFAVNKFGDVSTRNSSYSNTFSIPITARNRAVFESAEVVLNGSTVPYTQLSCVIYNDGLPVVSGYAQLLSVKDGYEIQVFGTNFDFFSLIKSKQLTELDLSAYDHTWNLTNVVASRTNTSGYIYGLICYQNELSDSYFPLSTRTIDVRQMYPGVFMHTIIDKIITEAGFTKSGDIFSDEDYLNTIIPFSKDRFTRDESTDEDFKAIKTSVQQIGSASSAFITFENDSTDGGFDNGGNYSANQKYTAPFAMKVDFNASITITTYTTVTRNITLRIYKNGFFGTVLSEVDIVQAPETTETHLISASGVDLNSGDYVEVYVSLDWISDIEASSYFECFVQPDIKFGTNVELSGSLPKIKQGDFFRWFLQMFQAVCQVKNGVVYVKKFSEIAADTENADDWSDKIDDTEETEIKFNMERYAQINNLMYKDDDSVVKPDGTDYELLIANENLPAETDLIVSPFAATQMITRLGNEVVPWIRINTALEITEKVEPRILALDVRNVGTSITYSDGTTTSAQTTSLPFMYFILPGYEFNLGFEDNLIVNYWPEVIEILQGQKVIKKLFRLTSADINQLDFFKPVWIDKYNCYFFKSEVSEYKINRVESTEVELIKLP